MALDGRGTDAARCRELERTDADAGSWWLEDMLEHGVSTLSVIRMLTVRAVVA